TIGGNHSMQNETVLKVYGRNQICASCVGAPSSWDTFEWLQAAIDRKYDTSKMNYEYIDMDKPQENEQEASFIEQMEEEDWLYPRVTLNGSISAADIPQIKKIYKAVDALEIDKKSS